jgi:antitoxin HigA-1
LTGQSPSHPGTHIRERCLEPLGLTVTAAAAALGVARKTLSELLNGRSGVSPEMAIRLSKAFGVTAREWMQLQLDFDLSQAERRAPGLEVQPYQRDRLDKTGAAVQQHIPAVLERYFWDQDPTKLTWDENRHAIVTRLMESGGWDSVEWLRAQMDDDELTAFLVRRFGRGISPKRLRFWGLTLGIPPELVDEWIAAQMSNPWSQRVRR